MHHLSLPEIALHLGDLYARAGRGWPPDDLHRQLADFLGCHPEVHAAAWALWATELELTGRDLGEPGGWLDFDFYEAVPVERSPDAVRWCMSETHVPGVTMTRDELSSWMRKGERLVAQIAAHSRDITGFTCEDHLVLQDAVQRLGRPTL